MLGALLGAVPVLEVWELRVPLHPASIQQGPRLPLSPTGAYTTNLIAMETDTAPAKPKHLRAAGNFPREVQPGSPDPKQLASLPPEPKLRCQELAGSPGTLGGHPELSGDLAGWEELGWDLRGPWGRSGHCIMTQQVGPQDEKEKNRAAAALTTPAL